MAGEKLSGIIKAPLLEVRFAASGKVAKIYKHIGDPVKKGEVLASLDTTTLQAELDKQLADYEKRRADFEIFALRETGDDQVTHYMKTAQQAQLNVAVKEVEIAKVRLDGAHLISPVNGYVSDTGGNVVGLHITPASNSFCLLDTESAFAEILLQQNQLPIFLQPHEAVFRSPVLVGEVKGVSTFPLPGEKPGQFIVRIPLSSYESGIIGINGEIELIT